MGKKNKDSVVKGLLPTTLDDIAKMKQYLDMQEQLVLKKDLMSNDPGTLLKANEYFKDIAKKNETATKSYIFDPWGYNNQAGFKDKPTSMSYNMLRNMAKTPIINSIITTRIEQVAAFGQPNYEDKGTGFVIQKKRGYFSKENKNTKQDEARIEWITNFVLNCGMQDMAWHGDTFDTFLRKFVRDSLDMDQGTFEIVRNRKGIPVEFLATDGATFRLADTFDDNEYKNNEKLMVNGYLPSYVQVFQGSVQAEFYPWELCFAIRNHYSDVRLNGYGVSELENMIQVVTWMLYSDTYNGKFFSQGSAPKGILKVSGGVNEAKLAEFRQQWTAMVAGVQNAWRTPVLESDKMEWIDLQKGNRDMEFSKWQEYLIKLSCAHYKMDPSEIGFPMNGSSNSKPMFEGNNEARLKYSKDKGLAPLLKMVETKINKYIINALDPSFEFKFVGLDPDTESEQLELDIKKLGNFMTIDELRKKYNLPKLKDGDRVLNSIYMQYVQAEKQEQQAQEAAANGAQGGPGIQGAPQPDMGGGEGGAQEQQAYNPDEADQQYQDFLNSEGGDNTEENPIEKAFNNFMLTINND